MLEDMKDQIWDPSFRQRDDEIPAAVELAQGPRQTFSSAVRQSKTDIGGDRRSDVPGSPRASGAAGGWRPRPGPLPLVIPWPSDGERQTGELLLRLYNMACLALGQLDLAALAFVHGWLKTVRSPLPSDITDAVRETLHRAGFTGCGEYVETTSGLFFPQRPLGNAGNYSVFVATEIFFLQCTRSSP